mmetsp:Transcript_26896/g.69018  ORF Transcript_26896/g.69018 Transcript_26896/m.69018 type:complete len:194 (+) Transcript_26896:133-714(+)
MSPKSAATAVLLLLGVCALLFPEVSSSRPAQALGRKVDESNPRHDLSAADQQLGASRQLLQDEGEEGDDDDDDDAPSPAACDHCLRVDFFQLGKSCNCMFDCCRPYHYDDDVSVEMLPLACKQYYYNTEQWKTCDDPCLYCANQQLLGAAGQDSCFASCCAIDKDDVTEEDTMLSYRVSESCHDWQTALMAQK